MTASTFHVTGRADTARSIARGKSGRLFYESLAGECTSIAGLAESVFHTQIAVRWKRLLETRGRLLKSYGLRLYILIAPDAHFIYRDEVPEHIALPARSPAQQFTELFSGIDNVTILNPEERLIGARGGLDVYKANDTHWSAFGAYVAYRFLIEALPHGAPKSSIPAAEVSYRLIQSFGDMGALVEPEVTANVPIAAVRNGSSRLVQDYAGEGRNAWKRFTSSRGRGHAFIPRDSFATELGVFINETFARVDWLGATSRLHLEAIAEEKPDIVIWQIAERRLLYVEHDHHPKSAYELYAFDRTTPFGKQALDAQLLLAEGKRAGALINARSASSQAEANGPYQYLFAEVLEANGHLEEAATIIKQAISLQDHRPAYWHLLSVIQRKSGETTAALAASQRAAQLFPHNALFVADHGYNLLVSDRTNEAIDLMQSCRELVCDSPHLSYWLAMAYLRVGDKERARGEAVNAYLLAPSHPDIFKLLWVIEEHLGAARKCPSSFGAPSPTTHPAPCDARASTLSSAA